MKDHADFYVTSGNGRGWNLTGYPTATHPTPMDDLAAYVCRVHRAIVDDRRNHRDVRPVPKLFAVTYSDDQTTFYHVRTVTIDNVQRDAEALPI